MINESEMKTKKIKRNETKCGRPNMALHLNGV